MTCSGMASCRRAALPRSYLASPKMPRTTARRFQMTAVISGSASPVVDVKGVTLQYKTARHLVTATYRVDFTVYAADRFVVLGPSGCGKSTLLKAVGGYLKTVEGEMRVKG